MIERIWIHICINTTLEFNGMEWRNSLQSLVLSSLHFPSCHMDRNNGHCSAHRLDNVVLDDEDEDDDDVGEWDDAVQDQDKVIQSDHSFLYSSWPMFVEQSVVIYTEVVLVYWQWYILDRAMFQEYHHWILLHLLKHPFDYSTKRILFLGLSMAVNVHENKEDDEFPYIVHIHRGSLRVSIGIIFLILSSSNKFDRKQWKVKSVRYIVWLDSIVSFSLHHQISACLYNVHIRNNHRDNRVHIVYS